MGIVLFGRERRLARQYEDLLEDHRRHLEGSEILAARVAEAEERLDFAERLLVGPRAVEPPPPEDASRGGRDQHRSRHS